MVTTQGGNWKHTITIIFLVIGAMGAIAFGTVWHISSQFDSIDDRLGSMNAPFDDVDRQLNSINNQLSAIGSRVTTLELKIDDLDARFITRIGAVEESLIAQSVLASSAGENP